MNEQEKQTYWERYRQAKEKGVSFFPDVVFKDAVVSLLVFLTLIALAYFVGTPFEARADPADTSYTPRPEWYFLWIFQLLKYFPGQYEVLGVVVLPTIGLILLFLLPFLDRSRRRHFINRPIVTAATFLAVVAVGGLSVQAAREAPPPTAATAAGEGDPIAALYAQNCAPCHGPSVDVSPGTDLHAVIAQGEEHEGMPAFGADLSTNEIDALAGFILSPRGRAVYAANCATCHEGLVTAAGEPLELKTVLEQGPTYPPHSDVDVPDWGEVLSREERTALLNFLAAPDGERLFHINCAPCHGDSVPFTGEEEQLRQIISQGGEHLEMPPWRETLNPSALDTLARYVVDPSAVPEGESLFEQNCSSCHGDRVPSAPDVDQARQIIAAGGAHETMPVWGEALTPEQLDALVSYTQQLARGEPVERGRELYSQYCSSCHGDFGEGGPNPARPGYVIPPISTAEYLEPRGNATLHAIISQGQPNFGMAPFGVDFGGPLDDEQVGAIVAFMRRWEDNPPVETPPEVPIGAAALSGAEVYADICSQCHGPNGEGGIAPALRDPELQDRYTDQEMFDVISQGHPATPMIGFGGILTSSQINDVLDYVRRLRAEPEAEEPPAEEAPDGVPSFTQDVMPVLEKQCIACHGEEGVVLGGWDASTYDAVINSGDHAPAVVPGDPEGSFLGRKILGTHSVGRIMPPSGKMPDDEIQVILDWIEAGAPDN